MDEAERAWSEAGSVALRDNNNVVLWFQIDRDLKECDRRAHFLLNQVPQKLDGGLVLAVIERYCN